MRSNVCHSSCACNAQIQRSSGQWQSAEYSTFSISDEAGKYQLSVSGYSGDAGDALAGTSDANYNADGKMFSTHDQDNDLLPAKHKAAKRGCGWWIGTMSLSRLNDNTKGRWKLSTDDPRTSVKFSRMLVRAN